jgi:hypothetical protein
VHTRAKQGEIYHYFLIVAKSATAKKGAQPHSLRPSLSP